MYLKYFIAGLFAKAVASFDDTVTRIPIVAQLTKTRKGRIAFSIGTLVAVAVAIIVAWFFSSLFHLIPDTHVFASILIILIALAIYFNAFSTGISQKIEYREKIMLKRLSLTKFINLIISGFIISLVTLIDDIFILSPLFLGPDQSQIFAIAGIYLTTIFQIIVIIYFAEKISKIKYLKEISVAGLLILALLVYFQIF